MANVLNLKEGSEDASGITDDDTRPSNARGISQKLEKDQKSTNISRLSPRQISSIRAAQERNGQGHAGRVSLGGNARHSTTLEQNMSPEELVARTSTKFNRNMPQYQGTGIFVGKRDARTGRTTLTERPREPASQQPDETKKEGTKSLSKRLFGLAGKMNPDVGMVAAGLSLFINPLVAAKKKFGESTVYLMIGTAIFFDTLIAIIDLLDFFTFGLASILVGSLFDFMALMTFTLWFKIKGAKFGKTRTLSLFAGFVLKFIPFADLLPDWTLAIFLSFLQENVKNVLPSNPAQSVTKRAGLNH